MCFVDLRKEFDRVRLLDILKILKKKTGSSKNHKYY